MAATYPADVKTDLMAHQVDAPSDLEAGKAAATGTTASADGPADPQLKSELPAWKKVPLALPFITWIVLSSATIITNKYILMDLGFPYAITLVTTHSSFQMWVSVFLVRVLGVAATPPKSRVSGAFFFGHVAPIGALYSSSVLLQNYGYLTLSVSAIQASIPVVVLLLAFAAGLRAFSARALAAVALTVVGVMVASYGELFLHPLGIAFQVSGIVCEAARLLLIQSFLQTTQMNPLLAINYIAPITLACNIVASYVVEGPEPINQIANVVPPEFLFLNMACTFALSLNTLWVISLTSGLALTLAGVVKDILLVLTSVAAFGSFVTSEQIIGYAVASIGIVLYKFYGSDC